VAEAPGAVNGDEVGGEFLFRFLRAAWVGSPVIFVSVWYGIKARTASLETNMVDGMLFRYGLPCGFRVFLTSANKMQN
jgi:hypothetical protein